MRIGEVSERYGISPDTLRYYEKAGIIPPVTRDAGGQRDYSEQDLYWVEVSKCMRSVGVPVETIAELIQKERDAGVSLQGRLALFEEQRRVVLRQREQLDALLDLLDEKIQRHKDKIQQETHR